FETAKKLLTVGFMLLYIFAPNAAAILSLLLLAAALVASRWALRRLATAYRTLFRPRLAPSAPSSYPPPRALSAPAPGKQRPGPGGEQGAGEEHGRRPAEPAAPAAARARHAAREGHALAVPEHHDRGPVRRRGAARHAVELCATQRRGHAPPLRQVEG